MVTTLWDVAFIGQSSHACRRKNSVVFDLKNLSRPVPPRRESVAKRAQFARNPAGTSLAFARTMTRPTSLRTVLASFLTLCVLPACGNGGAPGGGDMTPGQTDFTTAAPGQ